MVIINSEKDIIEQLNSASISLYCSNKSTKHSIQSESYLYLLINLMLLFVQTPVVNENIIGTAAELLCLLVKKLPTNLITTTLNSCAEASYKAFLTESKIEIYILNVLEALLSNKITISYQSKFADVLILGIRNDKKKIRQY